MDSKFQGAQHEKVNSRNISQKPTWNSKHILLPRTQLENESLKEIKSLVFGAQIKHGVGGHKNICDGINQRYRYPN